MWGIGRMGIHDRRSAEGHGAKAACGFGGGQEPNVVDDVPARLRREAAIEPRHGGPRDASADPPVEVARGVIARVLGGEVRRRRSEPGGGRSIAPTRDAVARGAVGLVHMAALYDRRGGVGNRGPEIGRRMSVHGDGRERERRAQDHRDATTERRDAAPARLDDGREQHGHQTEEGELAADRDPRLHTG